MTDLRESPGWTEGDSRHFIDYGAWFVPERETQIDTICSVIPPASDGAVIVDVCCGEGLLSQTLARRFPRSESHALDGSRTMRASATRKLEATGVAHRVSVIDLAQRGWRTFDTPVHAFASSLAIHHLDGPAKARLFQDLSAVLAPGGVLVTCDLVEAQREAGRELWSRHWDDGVRERSLALDGDEKTLEFSRDDGWNYYADPDAGPVDMPLTQLDQMLWMADAGLTRIDVHWLRAGHAISSGMKPQEEGFSDIDDPPAEPETMCEGPIVQAGGRPMGKVEEVTTQGDSRSRIAASRWESGQEHSLWEGQMALVEHLERDGWEETLTLPPVVVPSADASDQEQLRSKVWPLPGTSQLTVARSHPSQRVGPGDL